MNERSNCTLEELRRHRQGIFSGAAIKPDITAPRAVTRCIHAGDTGERAFVNLPCRGNRIICRRVEGLTTFAAACRPDKCKHYTVKKEEG